MLLDVLWSSLEFAKKLKQAKTDHIIEESSRKLMFFALTSSKVPRELRNMKLAPIKVCRAGCMWSLLPLLQKPMFQDTAVRTTMFFENPNPFLRALAASWLAAAKTLPELADFSPKLCPFGTICSGITVFFTYASYRIRGRG
jgi:hypothetical protein